MRYFRCAKFHFFLIIIIYYDCQKKGTNNLLNRTILFLVTFISFLFVAGKKKRNRTKEKKNTPLLGQEPSLMAIGLSASRTLPSHKTILNRFVRQSAQTHSATITIVKHAFYFVIFIFISFRYLLLIFIMYTHFL